MNENDQAQIDTLQQVYNTIESLVELNIFTRIELLTIIQTKLDIVGTYLGSKVDDLSEGIPAKLYQPISQDGVNYVYKESDDIWAQTLSKNLKEGDIFRISEGTISFIAEKDYNMDQGSIECQLSPAYDLLHKEKEE